MNPSIPTGLSRRDFLKLSALVAGATTLGFPSILRAQNAGTKLNVAVIGLGSQGRNRLKEVMACGVKIVALCDVDERSIQKAREEMAQKLPDLSLADAVNYSDYRKLLANEKNLDAVIIATPDHWHFHPAKAALLAGKHVFCEKPLTHTIAEARELRELSAKTKVITQMGNQGSASKNLRRGVELIQAGVLGQVKDVYVWVDRNGGKSGAPIPTVADPIPEGFNWDQWLGPAAPTLYKSGYYHPYSWRGWFDYGSGPMGDFGCHDLNLPFRALKLDYPTSIEVSGELMGQPSYPKNDDIKFEFAQRGNLAPVTIHWYDGTSAHQRDSKVVPAAITEYFGEKFADGMLIVGEKGFTYGGHWNGADYMMLNGEEKLSGILNHKASKDIAETLPRSPGHMKEWVNACLGGAPVFSDFETGGHLTEIALAGVVAARVGKKLEWDGPGMRANNAPEAHQYIHGTYRQTWI